MADIAKSARGVSLSTLKPDPANRLSGDLYAGEALAQGDVCYIKSDGSVWRSNGTAANAAAKARGITNQKYAVGEAVTLFRGGLNFGYSDGLLVPGADYYVSTTPGGLADAPSTGGANPVAFAVDAYRVHFVGEPTPAPGGSLSGASVATVADNNTTGGVPVVFRIPVADASADTDVVMDSKVRVIDAWGLNTGIAAHATLDTWQVKNGANAISGAVAKTATVNALKRIATIDPTYHEIAAGGTLRITAAKNTNAAVTVYVLAIPVA